MYPEIDLLQGLDTCAPFSRKLRWIDRNNGFCDSTIVGPIPSVRDREKVGLGERGDSKRACKTDSDMRHPGAIEIISWRDMRHIMNDFYECEGSS